MLDPCEQAVLEEEGACPGVRMPCGGSGRIRRNCRRGLELAAGSPNPSQLLGEFLVLCPTAGAGKETATGTPALQEELAWLLAGK